MTAQFDTTRLIAVPLTPVHVGGGEEAVLRPERYRFANDMLEVFAVQEVLDSLSDTERAGYITALIRDPLGGLERIRARVPPEAVLERIGVGSASRRELEAALRPAAEKGRQRRGDVQLFVRSGGRPLLPGSTIKGALRTAWLVRCAEGIEIAMGGRSGERHRALVRAAFALAEGKAQTDTDPLRDVTVSDAATPEGATRIDQVRAWKRTRERNDTGYGFDSTGQMHWERLVAAIDGGEPPLLAINVGVRSRPVREQRRTLRAGSAPSREPDGVAALLAALEAHHRPLCTREANEMFFAGPPGERLRQTLDLFAAVRRDGEDPDGALVRVGRGGHAESKSVAAFREVHRPQARDPAQKYVKEGTTRHVVELGGAPAPFGWMLLVRAERWRPPARWLPASSAGRAVAPGREREGAVPEVPDVATGLLFRRGDQVLAYGEEGTVDEDVRVGANEAMVRFPDSREPVPISEIKKR